MKYLFFLPIISLFSFLIFNACKPSKNSTDQMVQTAPWNGRWQWEATHYVRRGGETHVTPGDAGIEMAIELLPNGELKVYHNHILKKTYPYQVNKIEEEWWLTITYDKGELNPTVESGILRCTSNTLEIIGGYNDAGGNQTYKRVKD